MLAAIAAWKRGEYRTKASCAREHGLVVDTFCRRLAGHGSREDRDGPRKHLHPDEEQAIINFMLMLDNIGINGTLRTIETMAISLIKKRSVSGCEIELPILGKSWAARFATRHSDILMLQTDSIKELDRAAAEDPVVIQNWFNVLAGKRLRCGIQPDDTYNVDEVGFRMGIGKREKVVTRRRTKRKRVSSSKDANREFLTVVECVSAVGDFIPPLIILQSKSDRIMEDWVRDTSLPGNYLLETSETAYTNDEIALIWLKHFDKSTIKKQKGEWRMLIMDGHNSHSTFEFLNYCANVKILVYFLPSHTSQILQPLDVAVFQPYKHWHGRAVGDLYRLGISNINKVDFLNEINKIRTNALKKGTIKKGWKESGIWPHNPSIVLSKIPQKTPTPEPQDPLDPSIYRDKTTPNSKCDVDRFNDAYQLHFMSPNTVVSKLSKALDTAYSQLYIQQQQIDGMAAANRRKVEMSQSKRQILHPVGEPRLSEVQQMRNAVMKRKEKEDAAAERREVRKQKLLLKKAAAKKNSLQTVPEATENSEAEIVNSDPDTR